MLMTPSYMILVKDELRLGNEYGYTMVSLNEFDDAPLKEFILPEPKAIFPVGALVNDKFTEHMLYAEHKYDFATVLGEDAKHQSLLVYGYKIGKNIVGTTNHPYHNYMFYQRGDILLVKQLEKANKISIIHNITQAKLKQRMDKFGSKCI